MAQKTWSKGSILKTGEKVLLRDLTPRDSAKKHMEFYNKFVEEKAMVFADRKLALKEEKEWLKGKIQTMKKGGYIHIVAEKGGKIVGGASAERGPLKQRNNVSLGIALLPEFRGKGLGSMLMKHLIARVKREMKPKNIHLDVFSENDPAIQLYRKLGFNIHHTKKEWIDHFGEYHDQHFMTLNVK